MVNVRTKFGFVLLELAYAFLLLNPLSSCASMSASGGPADPCCPQAPVLPQDCATPGCVCLNTPEARTAVAMNTDNSPVTDLAERPAPVVNSLAAGEQRAFGPNASS